MSQEISSKQLVQSGSAAVSPDGADAVRDWSQCTLAPTVRSVIIIRVSHSCTGFMHVAAGGLSVCVCVSVYKSESMQTG